MKRIVKIILLLGLYALIGIGVTSFIGSGLDIPVVYKDIATGKIEGVMTEESYPEVINGIKEDDLPDKYEVIWTK